MKKCCRSGWTGALFHQIRQYAAEKGWNVSARQLYRYIDASDALLEKALEKNREKLIALHLAKSKNLFARCVNSGQYSVCLGLLRDEAALQGLYPPKAVTVDQPDLDCPACRERKNLLKLMTYERLPDGTLKLCSDPPEPCERCQKVPERIQKIVYVVTESRATQEQDATARNVGCTPGTHNGSTPL